MSRVIKLKILTPERIVYQDDVLEITLPTESGEITIMPTHAPLVTLAKVGEIRIKKAVSNEPINFSISGGIVEIRPSSEEKHIDTEVIVLAFTSENASEIDIDRSEEAYARAKAAMEEAENVNDVDFARLQALIDKELNRIKVAKKWRG